MEEKKQPPAYKQYPDLYYKNIWIDKAIDETLTMFAEYHKVSKKMMLRIFIIEALNQMAEQHITGEEIAQLDYFKRTYSERRMVEEMLPMTRLIYHAKNAMNRHLGKPQKDKG
jgi:hypothetical protein